MDEPMDIMRTTMHVNTVKIETDALMTHYVCEIVGVGGQS